MRSRSRGALAALGRRVDAAAELEVVLLRVGLGFVFAYASLAALADPGRFERYIPSVIAHPSVRHWCLPAFAAFELVLALSLVTGRRVLLASMLAAATLTGITVANLGQFDVLFRNVAIACAALSLAVLSRRPRPAATVIVLPD